MVYHSTTGDRFDFSSLSKEIFIIGMAQAFSNSPSSDPYHSEKLSNSSSSTALTAAALPDERFRLHYRFCGLAPVTPRCTTDKAAFCITPDNSDYVSLARFQTQDDISIAKTIPNGVELEISNLEDDFYGAMTLVITLTCSKAAGEAKSTLVTNNPYHIQFTQQHPAGCPASADSGLSGGWIFIIILLSVSFVYVALGCLYNWKRRGAKLGLEACPQRAMWAACLDNVKAGCLFTKSKVCGGKAGAAGDAGHATYGSQTDTDA